MKLILADAEGVFFFIAAYALGIPGLGLLVLILARMKKTRVFALCGSPILIVIGTIALWFFSEEWCGWTLFILCGMIPILSGGYGLFLLSKSNVKN